MAAVGAKYRWKEGKILHSARLWQAPSKRRIPRILIEDRALEVGILMHVEEPWMIFEETNQESKDISPNDAQALEYYLGRYHLLPATFKKQDTYEWLKMPGNTLLLWGINNKYYVKSFQEDSKP